MTDDDTIDLFSEDKVWDELSSCIAGRAKKGSKGFSNINCPMCVIRGEPRPDTRRRCGIKYDHKGIGVNCYNCGLKLRYRRGEQLSHGMRNFMLALGSSEETVKGLSFWAFRLCSVVQSNPEIANEFEVNLRPNFKHASLPDGAKSLQQWAEEGCDDRNFLRAAEYLFSRGETIEAATTYYWSPSAKDDMRKRIIVPFMYNGSVVGWTARDTATGDQQKLKQKYFNNNPSDYLFNMDKIYDSNRRFVLLTEGIFDALALDCVGVKGNSLNDKQIGWLNSTTAIKIVVPDQDDAGIELINIALKQKWAVAFPRLGSSKWWDQDVKDAAQAVARYGKLWTLRSILATATNEKMKIEIQKKLDRRN